MFDIVRLVVEFRFGFAQLGGSIFLELLSSLPSLPLIQNTTWCKQ